MNEASHTRRPAPPPPDAPGAAGASVAVLVPVGAAGPADPTDPTDPAKGVASVAPTLQPARVASTEPVVDGRGDDTTDPEAMALAHALAHAQAWPGEIASQLHAHALAELGDIDLPAPQVPTRQVEVLAALPLLYWVHGLDQAGLMQAADKVAGLWASGAIQVPLPDRGLALQQYWRERHQRLNATERAQLLGMVFDARDFEPALRRLCQALVALADNAGQRDLREEIGLEHAAQAVFELAASRLEGAAQLAAPDLMAQARAAVALLSQRPLQTAFAVRDFYAFIELGQQGVGGVGGIGGVGGRPVSARRRAEAAMAGAAVLRWLALSADGRFAIDVNAPASQTLIAQAQRWLMSAGLGMGAGAWAGAGVGHGHGVLGAVAA